MKNKKLLLGVGLLALVAVGTLFLNPTGRRTKKAIIGRHLMEEDVPLKVTELQITSSGAEVTINKGKDDLWHLKTDGFMADGKKIAEFFDDLGSLKIHSAMPTTADDDVEYGFDSPKVVLLKGEGTKELVRLNIGADRGSGGSFVRLGDAKEVYLTNSNIEAPSDPVEWENKALLKIEKEKVKAVSLAGAGKKAFVKASRAKPEEDLQLEGVDVEKTQAYLVKNLANLLENLSYEARVDISNAKAKAAMATPSLAEIELFEKGLVQVKVGQIGKDDKKESYIVLSLSDVGEELEKQKQILDGLNKEWWFRFPNHTADRFLKTKKDFLKQDKKS